MNGLLICLSGGETTILYPKICKAINDKYQWLDANKITPWVFFNDPGVDINRFNDRPIRLSGGEFSGSSRNVFWNGYIEPFLTSFVQEKLEWTSNQCKENSLDPNEHLDETAELLRLMVQKVYEKMADIDRRIRGKGFPDRVAMYNVDGKIDGIQKFIEEHLQSEKELWKSRNESNTISTTPDKWWRCINWEILTKIAIILGIVSGLIAVISFFLIEIALIR